MGVVVLIIIGVVIWLIIRNDNQNPKKTTNHRQSKADKEFEDMYFNGASRDDIDDF
ncbi:MAG: hypothetical protein IJ529_01730 [Alphaproteobacteria bacterium]|nr:hypothetical protein [Alphaproteobacteria bacterium]